MVGKLEVELMGQTNEAIMNGLPFILAFRTFEQVVSTCFAVTLKEGYPDAIMAFRAALHEFGNFYFTKGIYCGHL